MNRYCVAVASALVAAVWALTACPSAVAHAQDTATHTHKTALWKVTSAHRTMYITGSVGCSLKKYPLPGVITRAFSKSGELTMEGKTNATNKEKAALMMKYGLQPSGEKLNDDLDASQLKLVKKAFSTLPVSHTLAELQSLQPWVAVMLLHHALHKTSTPHVKPHALFVYFHNKAKSEDMPVTFLNTVAGEFKLYASMPQAAWLTMMAKTALKPEKARKRARERMIRAWRSGDIDTVEKYYKTHYQSYPKVYDTLVTSYESRWLKTLQATLNKSGKPVFVIVNAANLVGPVNILHSLSNAGYDVSQL
jgi:uncharacterized protein YbaP (TraB family)